MKRSQYSSETWHRQRFFDGTAVVGCIRGGQESEYRKLVRSFVEWPDRNPFLLNASETKWMVAAGSVTCFTRLELSLARIWKHLNQEWRSLDCLSIIDNPSYLIHSTVVRQKSSFSFRFMQFCCHKECFMKSVKLYNSIIIILCVTGEHTIPHISVLRLLSAV